MRARAAALVFASCLAGCAASRSFVADSGDLADYRAFRVAARQGTRLARARHYVEAHPHGAWTDEVKRTFEDEEPLYFEAAKESRKKTSEYLADLPDGPHAAAAIALLTAFDTHMDEIEMEVTLREARRTEAMLDRASIERKLVGETILGAVGALLESIGTRFTDASPSLRLALGGPVPPTWGRFPVRREEDLYFSLPTRPVRESRLLTLTVEVALAEDEIAGGRVEGADLFIRWLEADRIVALDPTRAEDRTEAAVHAMELLGGALEARFPASSCQSALAERELFARRCGGFTASVTVGRRVGDMDSIVIIGAPK